MRQPERRNSRRRGSCTRFGALIARSTDSVAPLPVDHVEQARLGALRLTTIGRKSARQCSVIIGYLEDGPNLVALAMNGWDDEDQ
jgi:hypothetical protein